MRASKWRRHRYNHQKTSVQAANTKVSRVVQIIYAIRVSTYMPGALEPRHIAVQLVLGRGNRCEPCGGIMIMDEPASPRLAKASPVTRVAWVHDSWPGDSHAIELAIWQRYMEDFERCLL